MGFEEELDNTFCADERRLEAKLSAMKTRSPKVVLVGDPQSIKYLSAGLNPVQKQNKDNMIETLINNS